MAPVDICPRRFISTHSLRLVEFGKNDFIPRYAILSHRWNPGGEVVYKEFLQYRDATKSKSGYRKIEGACRLARKDGIDYLWVDTCCIRQGNHEDVVANITSMYAYYQNAEVCYAYLEDVEYKYDMFHKLDASRCLGSEWLRRGWTLQELLAPRTVIFYNKRWQRIGTKDELRDDLHLSSGIPVAVLSNRTSIHDVDELTRMSWAIGRETTRPQDGAYCLQGLLGIWIEPDYGEKWETSWNRLGKALFETRPDLKNKLGISDSLFSNPASSSFYDLLWHRFSRARVKSRDGGFG